jgi:hypothetical protein
LSDELIQKFAKGNDGGKYEKEKKKKKYDTGVWFHEMGAVREKYSLSRKSFHLVVQK